MNQAELEALLHPISNDARVLYVLGLRPTANTTTGASDLVIYKHLMQLLNTGQSNFTRGREVNVLFDELFQHGLISYPIDVDSNKSLNNKRVILPLLAVQDSDVSRLHQQKRAIRADWQPDPALTEQLTQLVGLVDKQFSEHDVGDFVAYWMGRPETRLTEYQWTQKFVSQLKQKRLARQPTNRKQIGSQTVDAKSGIEIDDNARKLVEKYASKQ